MHNFMKPYYGKFYHNCDHVNAMLAAFAAIDCDKRELMELAILFHDIDPEFIENISCTQNYMIHFNYSLEDIIFVLKVIASTTNHVPYDKYSEIICDLDLMILAGTWPEYSEYVNKVKLEFPRGWELGRKPFLKQMLNRDKLFHIFDMEERARRNMKLELEFYV